MPGEVDHVERSVAENVDRPVVRNAAEATVENALDRRVYPQSPRLAQPIHRPAAPKVFVLRHDDALCARQVLHAADMVGVEMGEDNKLQLARGYAARGELLMHRLPQGQLRTVKIRDGSAEHAPCPACVVYAVRTDVTTPAAVYQHRPARVLDEVGAHRQLHARRSGRGKRQPPAPRPRRALRAGSHCRSAECVSSYRASSFIPSGQIRE